MLGRTMVLPSGNYTLSFDAFACNATNSAEPTTLPSAGDAVAFLTGQNNVDITNIAAAGDGTFHTVSFTFDVTTDNTAYEFGIKKLTDDSKIDWCQIKNVSLVLNSTNIFPIDNNSTASFTYSGSQDWHTNTWSTEGQSDGSRFQVPFHELWVANGSQLADATIKASYTPTESGFYKVSAWVRTVNEAEANNVSGVNFFVGNSETDACTGNSVIDDKGRLNTHTALIYGVSETPFEYGLKVKNANINWLAFKNVTVTYLGAGSASSGIDITQLITNPSFSSAYTTGWTLDGTAPNAYNSTYGAYENYHRVGGLHQDLTDLPNGVYKVTMQAAVRVDGGATGTFNLFATTSNGTTKSPATVAAHTDFATMAQTMTNDPSFARIETYAIVTDGNLTIGHYESNNSTWPVFDNYTLTYYGEDSDAYALAMASEAAKANTSISAMEDGSMKTAMNAAYSTKSANPTLANIQWMTFIANSKSELVEASNLGIAADAVAAVAYTETVSGSYSTYTDAISAFQSSVTSATTTDAVTTAMTTLKSAIKTYIAGAKPANEGEYFDITCLMANPNFDGDITDWTYISAPGVNWSNCEYYQSEFDINQTVTGLPTGSYSLNVQAFQRPGWANDVWTAYNGGTDNATSVLYINSITSKVKNIAADAQSTAKLGTDNWGTWPNDSRVGSEGSYKYLPNSQQGAKLYFDAGLYDATCAAVVTEEDGGSLKLGFKSTANHVDGDWTIFDNFRLHYYGSSLLVYYKQYLPQLREEANADLSNGAYTNVLGGKEEADFRTALDATPTSETEEAYKAVIDDILEKQTAFRAAKSSYDALVAAKASNLTKITENIGSGIFQYNETTNNSLYSEYETAKSNVDDYTVSETSTAVAVQTLVDALDDAIDAYNNQQLNAPAANNHYNIIVATANHAKENNAIVISRESVYPVYSYDYVSNNTGFTLNASAVPNVNLAQACAFIPVDGKNNTYYISMEREEGTVYLTYGTLNDSKVNWKDAQIQATTDASKKGEFRIFATETDNVFNIYNTLTNSTIACQTGGNIYTEAGNADFTIAEASQATVNVTISADLKYVTRIFPFNPELPSGVTAYSCEETDGNILTLVEVTTPQANVPYILKAEEGCTSTDLQGWGTASTTEYTAGWLTGVYTDTSAKDGWYVLQNNNNKFGFYKVNTAEATPTVGAYRCYLTVPDGNARAAFFFDDELSGIEAVNALTQGKSTIYDANGRQLTTLQKGMNIVKANGKTYKVIVK